MSDLAKVFGPTAALSLFWFFLGSREVWVWGWIYKQERAEKIEWKERALEGTLLASDAVSTAEVVSLKDRRRKA